MDQEEDPSDVDDVHYIEEDEQLPDVRDQGVFVDPIPLHQLKNPSWTVRERAVSALEDQAEVSAIAFQALISALEDENWSVREAAERMLGSQSGLNLSYSSI